jgi:hypothetical protein
MFIYDGIKNKITLLNSDVQEIKNKISAHSSDFVQKNFSCWKSICASLAKSAKYDTYSHGIELGMPLLEHLSNLQLTLAQGNLTIVYQNTLLLRRLYKRSFIWASNGNACTRNTMHYYNWNRVQFRLLVDISGIRC